MKARLAIILLVTGFLLTTYVSDCLLARRVLRQRRPNVTGRTMDWFVSDMDTNMWLYPRGLERTSNTKTPFNWKSKYGSVVVTIYEGAAADGMNEKGLVATCSTWQSPSIHQPRVTTNDLLADFGLAQYVLDSYATTAEAVAGYGKKSFVWSRSLRPP